MRTQTSTAIAEISSGSERSRVVAQPGTPRLALAYTLFLSRAGAPFDVVTKTENVSSKGFFCFCQRPFLVGERLDCEMVIPRTPGHPGTELSLRCAVEVVRVTRAGGGRGYEVDCRLENYTIGRPRPPRAI
jgi:hypothetical protein